jgi:hypothetical protein
VVVAGVERVGEDTIVLESLRNNALVSATKLDHGCTWWDSRTGEVLGTCLPLCCQGGQVPE